MNACARDDVAVWEFVCARTYVETDVWYMGVRRAVVKGHARMLQHLLS